MLVHLVLVHHLPRQTPITVGSLAGIAMRDGLMTRSPHMVYMSAARTTRFATRTAGGVGDAWANCHMSMILLFLLWCYRVL